MADEFFNGQTNRTSSTSDFNQQDFHTRQRLQEVRTTVPVKIIAVHGGGVGAPAKVDVQPLVNQIDGAGNRTEHGIIYGIPCYRSQGGTASLIVDPSVGDIGMMSIADRDISALKANEGAQSNPGSFRQHDLADGIYVGTILNPATPNKFIHLTGSGISMQDEFGNTHSSGAAGWNINGAVIDQGGNINTPGNITFAGGISGKDHVHTEVQPGAGLSGPPEV